MKLRRFRQTGFTLIELVVSMGITVLIMGAIFEMVSRGNNVFRTLPEAADMIQAVTLVAAQPGVPPTNYAVKCSKLGGTPTLTLLLPHTFRNVRL